MAPNTTIAAYAAYERAITRLKTACTSLERQIPPPENADGTEATDTPPIRPRESNVEVTACQACATELEEMDPNDRAGHACTHEDQGNQPRTEQAPGSGPDDTTRRKGKNKQPKAGVLREYMGNMDACLEKFTDTVANLCSALTDVAEKERYQDHLIFWVEHCEDTKDRAREVIDLLEAAQITTAQPRPQVSASMFTFGGPSGSGTVVVTTTAPGTCTTVPLTTAAPTYVPSVPMPMSSGNTIVDWFYTCS